MNIKVLLFLLLMQIDQAVCNSLVYSLKIRRQFNLAAAAAFTKKKSFFIASSLPVFYKRDRKIIDKQFALNICEKDSIVGSILNFRFISSKHWWTEATTGIEKESVKVRGSSNFNASRMGLDDIVLSAGYDFILPNQKSQLVFYALGGIPTKTCVNKIEAQNTLVGTRFYSLGIGSEFSYSFVQSLKKVFTGVFQVRFLHFFDRNWSPILPPGSKIQPGNLIDLLLTFQIRHIKNIFEFGYNPTYFTNQALIINNGTSTQKIKSPNFVRKSFYLTLSRLFRSLPLIHAPGLIGIGFSFANAERFDTRIRTAWLNFSAIF